MNNKLVAVVSGMPFSGTTYLSRIICSHPNIDSGFECGMLFEESPKLFTKRKKFYNWMMSHEKPYNWKLSSEEMNYICDTDSFYTAYDRIVETCHLFTQNKANLIIDKTPAYIYRLRNIMTKIDKTPFIIVKKDPIYQYSSYKNRGKNMDDFITLYKKQIASINRILNRPILKNRLLIVNFADLHTRRERSIEEIFSFISNFSNINFSITMIPAMIESIESDITSNVKKLRKKYNYKTELMLSKTNLTNHELSVLTEL